MSDQEDKEGKKILTQIVLKGVMKALLLPRPVKYISFRKIWEDMIGEMLDILDPNSSKVWKQLSESLQDEIAEKIKVDFTDFLKIVNEAQDALVLEELSPSSITQ